MGAECREHRGLYLFDDLAIFEVVDEAYRPVPPGIYGNRLLITVLSSRTVPLIRYELGDSLRLATQPCPCGRPHTLIDGIQGRTEEVLSFPDLSGGQVAVQPNFFHRLMDTLPVSGWQIVQEPDRLLVLLSGLEAQFPDSGISESLRQSLQSRGVVAPPVQVRRVPAIPRGLTGKAPLIKSNLPT